MTKIVTARRNGKLHAYDTVRLTINEMNTRGERMCYRHVLKDLLVRTAIVFTVFGLLTALYLFKTA